MKCLLVYSSVTGNTRAVAEAVLEALPAGTLAAPAHKAPDPEPFDFIALGFWVRRGGPDPRTRRYMARLQGKTVAWFGTLAAWPDSAHARHVRENTEALLAGNRSLGGFLCQGRLEARRFAAIMNGTGHSASHPLTPERRARLLEAEKHPDERDFAGARAAFAEFLRRLAAE